MEDLNADFIDMASMSVLARCALESFLVFHYLFSPSRNDAERELRYQSWLLADLMDRQEVPENFPESKEIQKQDAKDIESIKKTIERNTTFQALSKKQQARLLNKKWWRRSSWTDIARDAGLSELHAKHAYRYLCSYAHSGSRSVLQVREARKKVDQQFLAQTSLRLVNLALAFMTRAYCSLFEKAGEALAKQTTLKAKVEHWIYLGETTEENAS